jgi:hypothetical protein
MATPTHPENVQLVLNNSRDDHSSVLKLLLHSAQRFECITALAKQAGLKLIRQELTERLRAGLQARFVIGLNF